MGKKYVWAYISFFDHEMKMGHGTFEDEKAACLHALELSGWELDEELKGMSLHEIKQYAFDGDSMVGAYCVS